MVIMQILQLAAFLFILIQQGITILPPVIKRFTTIQQASIILLMVIKTLMHNITGSGNTADGLQALLYNAVGNYNTANGFYALLSNTTGSNNTALGFATDLNNGDYSNTTLLGSSSVGTASNQVRIGNQSVQSIGGYTDWTNISDGRVKKNIKQNVPGLAFINKLNPITYNLDLIAADKIIQRPVIKDKDE